MMALSTLTIDLAVGMAGFESDMGRAAKTTERQMAAMKRDAEAMGRALGAAFVATAAAVAVVVSKTIDAADNIRDMSIKTGISTAALSEYESVAKKTGTSLDAFVTGVNKMQRSLIEAAEGSQVQADAFRKLGLSTSELLKLEPDKQFEAIAEEVSKLGNAAERTAVSQAIFGRGAAALAPLMAEGAKGIEEARAKAEAFGITIGQEFADNADRFNDNMVDMRDLAKGVGNQFTAGLLPALIDLQEGFLGMERDVSAAQTAGESLGNFIKQLVAAFIVLKQVLTAVGVTLVSVFVTAAGAVAALISPLTGLGVTLERVADKIASGDVIEGLKEFANAGADIATTFSAATDVMKTAGGATADAWGPELKAALDRAMKAMSSTGDEAKRLEKSVNNTTGAITKSTAAITAWTARQAIASKSIEASIKAVEEIEQAQVAYTQSVQDFIDVGDPVGALVREFSARVEQANKMLAAGSISAKQYQDSINALSNGLGQAAAGMVQVAQESDAMKEAMLEGVRILERSFQSMWQNILEGGDNIFDGLIDGFKSMLGNMIHQATTRKIVMQIEAVMNGGKMDFKQLAEGIAGMAGVIIGSKMGGGGEWANTGAALGSVIGSIAGPIGTAIGGVLGGMLGGLFDKDKPMVLEVSGFSMAGESKSDTDSVMQSIFGTSFLRSRRIDAAAIAQYKDAIEDFDTSIASFLDDSQIGAISEALKTWSKQIEGETLSLEELLSSRFGAILSTFTADIRAFVKEASGLEDQASRLQVAVNAQNLMASMPDMFEGRTLDQFLNYIEAFQSGVESITDAFNEVLQLLTIVQSVSDALSDYSDSSVLSDFQAILAAQNQTAGQALIGAYGELGEAIALFDGSIASFQNIGSLMMSVREGEIRYLTQLHQLQQGLNASLDTLRADMLGLTEMPKTGADIFNQARDLVFSVLDAQAPEDIARIGQQFEALLRSISPEDATAMQGPILQLIDSFQAASNDMIESFRADAVDNAASMRDLVDVFLHDIGDPLDIIAATNERAAAALEALAGTTPTPADGEPPLIGEGNPLLIDGIIAANTMAADNQNRILEEGMRDLSRTMADGSSFTAAALASAIRNGDFRFTLVVKESDLVTR